MGDMADFLTGNFDDEFDDEDSPMWRSAAGLIAISDMEESHLDNAIGMLQRKASEAIVSTENIAASLSEEPLRLPEHMKKLTINASIMEA